MKKIIYMLLGIGVFSACQNRDFEFPDFDYQTVYFATQYPVRTVTLGEDVYDTSLDNEGIISIMATTGGIYENESDVIIDIVVENSLVENMAFEGGGDIVAMPSSHYTIESDRIVIPEGSIVGGVKVQLTDAFFADPLSVQNHYVIPVRMTEVANADSILSGVSASDEARRGVSGTWAIQPKDFTFYAVKYVNPWHGAYLRRGTDVIEGKNGNTALDTTVVRRAEYVEQDEVVSLATESFITVNFPLDFPDATGSDVTIPLHLNFAEDGSVTVEAGSDDFTASGSGRFVEDSESWGGKDRDAIYLNYEIEHDDFSVVATDTLVLRDRGISAETFSPILK